MEPTRVADIDADACARANFESHLERNRYPGRGLAVGRSSDGEAWLLVYFIMGRSAHSRNRRFVQEGSTLRTEPVDTSRVEDPSLIIYEAMLEGDATYLVTNGDQTRTIYDALADGGSFDAALASREREPDAPNYTPRISAILDLREQPGSIAMSILKANPLDPRQTNRTTFRPAAPAAGFAWLLTTYRADGSPLPSFCGDPLAVPCAGTPAEILEKYWKALDEENRISLAVKRIPCDGAESSLRIKNRH